MYIRRTTRHVKGKTYQNHLLVESVATPNGPRQRVICSLGALAPAPKAMWLGLAQKLHASLAGQTALLPDPAVDALAARVRPPRRAAAARAPDGPGAAVTVDTEHVTVEDVREAGPVHAGHQVWRALTLDAILAAAGLSARARVLTEVMTLNRLVSPAGQAEVWWQDDRGTHHHLRTARVVPG
jgi:hypothetical protein